MGMDVYGNSPITDDGEYFRANLWSWRPIHLLCDKVIDLYNLKISTDGWEFNDGKGLEDQEDCNILANAMENYLEFRTGLESDDDVIYLNLGMWSSTDGSFIDGDVCNKINEMHRIGTVLEAGVVLEDGRYVVPSHCTSVGHIKHFIKFLRNCGGFSIL